ncbi:MAG: hypothetical protein KIS79_00130 [Burkholderiales bacterium]|nr:hypothetical protein [Burkholderiales bacterium]
MKSGLTLLALSFAVLLFQAYARTERLSEAVHVGSVVAIFDEVSQGIYEPRGADGARSGLSSWAHVRFSTPLVDGRIFAVAKLPEGLEVRIDDAVAVRFGDASPDSMLDAGFSTITGVLGRDRPLALR